MPALIRRFTVASIALGVFGLSVFVYVVWASRLLRPAADDYCFGYVAGRGPVAAVWHWFTTWGGDVISYASTTALVGMPLANLPWPLVSSIAFIAAVVSATIAVLVVSHVPAYSRSRRDLLWLVPAAVIPMAWWSYWWIPSLTTTSNNAVALARATTFWQNINAGYVVPTALAVATLVLVDRHAVRPWLRRLAFAGVGLAVGLAGPVLAVSIVIVATGLLLLSEFFGRSLTWAARADYLVLAVAIVAGASIAYLSPGSQARSQATSPSGELSLQRLVPWTFPDALSNWGDVALNAGTLVATTLVVVAGYLIQRAGVHLNSTKILRLSGVLILLSLVMSIVSRASEFLVYRAYWHLVPIGTTWFVGITAAGLAAGGWLARRSPSLQFYAGMTLVLTTVLVTVPMLILGTGTLVAVVQKRHMAWDVGPAPLETLTDIEDGSGWVRCWVDLEQYREIPSRVPADLPIPDTAPLPTG